MSAESIRLEVSGAAASSSAAALWHVVSLDGEEHIHAPFRFTVRVVYPRAKDETLTGLDDFMGEKASIFFHLHDGSERAVHGVVRAVRSTYDGHVFTIEPHLALLSDTVDHQVFLGDDAAQIAAKVCAEHQVKTRSDAHRAFAKRDQCVQAFETDLDFVRRVLAEEGAAIRFEHDSGEDVAVFVDAPTTWPDITGDAKLPFAAGAGLDRQECVSRLVVQQQLVTDAFTLRDYDFERPDAPMTSSATAGGRGLQRYEFPGHFKLKTVGDDLAGIRLGEAQRDKLVLRGEANTRRLEAGRVLEVESAPHEQMNGRWLIVEVKHRARERSEERYRATFVAVPAAVGYRPARLPDVRLGGVQTAIVTGPGGSEVHTDQHARMKMHFRFDRRRPVDDTSSFWLRSIQPPTSGGVMLPRVGWETLVGFASTSGDLPFEIGRMIDGAAPPTESLPGSKVVSDLKTGTTPGGGTANVLRTDDTAGKEQMALTASKDMSETIANDREVYVKGSEVHEVGGKVVFSVGERCGVDVKGRLKEVAAATHEISAKTNHEAKAKNELVAVGGARIFNVGGDTKATTTVMFRMVGAAKAVAAIESQSRKVTAAAIQVVGASWQQAIGLGASVSVLGGSIEKIGAAKVIRCKTYELKTRKLTETLSSREQKGKKIEDVIESDATYHVTGAATWKGEHVKVKVADKITLKGSGATITLEPSKVTIAGKYDGEAPFVDEGDQRHDG